MKKTLKRNDRILSAIKWIKTYSGKNLVKGYSNKYAVDKLTAIKDLRLIGVEISEEYESQLRQSLEYLKHQRILHKLKQENELISICNFDFDENFAMILGYTSNGFPYGLSHEEMDMV